MKYYFLTFLLASASSLFANDNSFLDPAYNHTQRVKVSPLRVKAESKNDIELAMSLQSPVRSQESRGTCSIFSATAFIESTLIENESFDAEVDLSEEWLQYTSVRGRTTDGSSAPSNFDAIKRFGMVSEETLPYIGSDWTKTSTPLRETRCGHLTGTAQISCHITHFDPALLTKSESLIEDKEFVSVKKEALKFKKDHLNFKNNSYYLFDTAAIKDRLMTGKPVVLEINFYYGAWNHRGGESLGIVRNMDHWAQGIIGHPEPGILDREKSSEKPAGHSVLVVGFDDNKIVKKKIQMADGTSKMFTYKGVYYIKNSWGTESFGSEFEVDGVNYPGYGMIVQKHANQDGSFFALQ
jgi:hypothetical protein